MPPSAAGALLLALARLGLSVERHPRQVERLLSALAPSLSAADQAGAAGPKAALALARGTGMVLAALSFVFVAWLQKRIEGGEQLSILWQLLPYLVITMAEVLISTTGLEFAFTQAPAAMKSTITGYWQLTVAVGNLVVVFITAALGGGHGDESVTSGRFMLYAAITAVVAVIFSVIAAFYRYRDHAAEA
jgi:dipeptide/tripeptide permease